jgi:outer membrane protein insertion porin family
MPKVRHIALVLLCWLGFVSSFNTAFAQIQPAAPPTGSIDEIIVTGTDDDTIKGLVKVTIDISVGDPVENVKAEEIQNQLLALGFFKTVKVTLEVRDSRNVVVIAVESNPVIGEVIFTGNAIVPSNQLIEFLDKNFNIGIGVTVNESKLKEAATAVGQAYRQVLPFEPEVKIELGEIKDGKQTVTFNVTESASIKSVEVIGATLVPEADIKALYKSMVDGGAFKADVYQSAAQAVRAKYNALGYRYSGPSFELSKLVDGVLTIRIIEYKIAAVDATALGVNPDDLSLKTGDFFNYDTLLKEVQRLAKGRDKQVGVKIEPAGEDTLIVTLTLEEAAAGPITTINIQGNTAVPSNVLLARFKQKVGDTYNPKLAEEDFSAINDVYQEAGYGIVPEPKFGFSDGIYTITIQEQKLIGFEINWRGYHRTDDRVITRELPKVGGLFNITALRASFGRIQQLGLLKDLQVGVKIPDPSKPYEIVLVLGLEEGSSGNIVPGITYSTLDGFAGQLSVTEQNLWGQNHRINLGIQGGPNDAGQTFSGGLSYTIPWLDIDFLDFRETRTEVTFSISTSVSTGNPIPNYAVVNSTKNSARLYSARSTGFGFSVSRPVGENFSVRVSFDFSYESNYLETDASKLPGATSPSNSPYQYTPPCDKVADPTCVDPVNPPPDQACNLKIDPNCIDPAIAALRVNAPDNLTVYTQVAGQFSTKNRQDFPTQGVLVTGTVGYGFGTAGIGSNSEKPLSWEQTTVGFRTYLGFGWDQNGKFDIGDDRKFALAFRFNTGFITGDAPANRLFRIGGSSQLEDYTLRGYDFNDLRGQLFYTGSLELRYDFGLQTSFTYGLLGIAFLDFGNAWGGGDGVEFRASRNGVAIPEGLQFGFGLGVQINLGFGSFQLPAIRLDYAFSPWNPGGKFHFRLGFPF